MIVPNENPVQLTGDLVIGAAKLVDEVQRLRGSIILLLYRDRPPQIDLRVRSDAGWLIEEIHRRKSKQTRTAKDAEPCG
jgi:hypothetical protein